MPRKKISIHDDSFINAVEAGFTGKRPEGGLKPTPSNLAGATIGSVAGFLYKGAEEAVKSVEDLGSMLTGKQKIDFSKAQEDIVNIGLGVTATSTLTGITPKGSLGVFGGRMGKGFSSRMESLSIRMEKEGASPQDIFERTGMWRGKDMKWRYEITPEGSTVDTSIVKDSSIISSSLEAVYNHETLYENYPDLRNKKINYIEDPSKTFRGASLPNGELLINRSYVKNEKDLRSVLEHEITHDIQKKEGHAIGGSPAEMGSREDYLRLYGEQEAREAASRTDYSKVPTIEEKSIIRRLDKNTGKSYYWDEAKQGEVM